MDMLGQRFRPLANSPRYGPKKWKQDSSGVWVEQERTPLDRFENDLAGDSAFFDSTKRITEADSRADPALRDYVGGFAVFPRMKHYPVDSPEARKQERLWQAKSEKMHDQQTTLSLEAKPDDGGTTGKYYKELKRGD